MADWFLKNINSNDVERMLRRSLKFDVVNLNLKYIKSEDELKEDFLQFIAACKDATHEVPFTFMGKIYKNYIMCAPLGKSVSQRELGSLKYNVYKRLNGEVMQHYKVKKQTTLTDFGVPPAKTGNVSKVFDVGTPNQKTTKQISIVDGSVLENKSAEHQVLIKLQQEYPEFTNFDIYSLQTVQNNRPEIHFEATAESIDYNNAELDDEGNYVPHTYYIHGVKSGKYFNATVEEQEDTVQNDGMLSA